MAVDLSIHDTLAVTVSGPRRLPQSRHYVTTLRIYTTTTQRPVVLDLFGDSARAVLVTHEGEVEHA